MKLSIGLKILTLLGVSTVVALGVALTSFVSTNELVASSNWVAHTYKVINTLDVMQGLLQDAENSQRGFVITNAERYLAPYERARTKLGEQLAEFRAQTIDNPHQTARADAMKPLIESRLAVIADVIAVRQSSFEAARKIIASDKGKNLTEQIRALVAEASAEEAQLLAQRDRENAQFVTSARAMLMVGVGLILLVFAGTAYFVRSGIVRPLQSVMALANGIAVGNLRQQPLAIASKDEIGTLATIFNNMLKFLREMATQNAEVARNLGTSASEILAAIQQQAAAVREQATAIQQTTTTMEEIGQSGVQVNERGRQISSAAEATLAAANAGVGAVQGTNLTMVSIRSQVESVAENIVNLSERNQTIGEIISSVNDISEQSNLLALNAAIEAADAGEHGRRFSVVANELKNLSEQAKSATVQVRQILGQIQKGINTSVMLTEEAVKRAEGGKAQADIAEHTILQLTGTTSDSIKTFQQIVGATNQQQIGFEQITQALKSIRIGAEQTAASTNQLEKAAMSLNSLGQQLQTSTMGYSI